MLQAIRDRATGWIAWVIIILICIPFALWGINSYFEGEGGLAVARVNDTEIDYYQYRNALQQQRQQLQQMFGGAIPAGLISEARMREQALNRLVGDEVLVQQAVGNGLRVGDGQLVTAIQELPVFQQDGHFSQSLYEQFLRSRGSSAAGFELDLRRSMLAEQVITALRRTEIVTPPEVDALLQARNEQRRFTELRVTASTLEVPTPDDAAIQARFEAEPERYVQPERVKVRYIELDRETLASEVTADDAELRAIYEERVAQGGFVTPEQREARHILITVPSDAPDEAVQEAKETLLALRARIEAGEDFAEVAKTGSQDPGSAAQGGSLGFFGRGVMDPAFEEAAFSQSLDELGEAVRSRFGWHLIQVTQIQPEQVREFEQARADVLTEYQASQASQIFAEQAEQLANLAFENPESLEVAAEALGVEPATSGFFSRGGEQADGIARVPAVREAAFSDDVLNAGNNSELVEVSPDRLVVLRVDERQPSRPNTLDEVRDEIVGTLMAEARAQRATSLGTTILEALQGGADPEAVAAEHGLTWSGPASVTRSESSRLAPALAELLFAMPKPEGDAETVDGTALGAGDYVVVRLSEVSQASPDDAGDIRQQLAEGLESSYGEQTFTAVMDGLRERTDVEVFQHNLDPDAR